jgi:hypothetical protein
MRLKGARGRIIRGWGVLTELVRLRSRPETSGLDEVEALCRGVGAGALTELSRKGFACCTSLRVASKQQY